MKIFVLLFLFAYLSNAAANSCNDARAKGGGVLDIKLVEDCERLVNSRKDPQDQYKLGMIKIDLHRYRDHEGYRRILKGVEDINFRQGDWVSFQEGISLLEESASQGFLLAQVELGKHYSYERYLTDPAEKHRAAIYSLPKAVRWLKISADRGHADSQHRLGELFLKGKGVPQDLPRGLRLLSSSVLQENFSSAYTISLIFLSSGSNFTDAIAEAWRIYGRELSSRSEIGAAFLSMDQVTWNMARALRERPPLDRDQMNLVDIYVKEIRSGQFNEMAIPLSAAKILDSFLRSLEDGTVKKRLFF